MEEIWRFISEYENYMVSNLGRIKNIKTNRILKLNLNSGGYYSIGLHKNNKCYTKQVHVLVAETFLQNSNNYTVVHHKDNNKLNNHLVNLEWTTHKGNSEYYWSQFEDKSNIYKSKLLNHLRTIKFNNIEEVFNEILKF